MRLQRPSQSSNAWVGRTLLTLAVLFVGAALATTKAQAQTGSLEVYVFEKDSGGKAVEVVGASVQLSDTAAPKRVPDQTKQTDLDGKAVFENLPVGRGYLVTIIAVGYNPATEPKFNIVAGRTTPLRIQILPTLNTTVDVKGNAQVVEIGKDESTTTISGEFFNDLPVYGRDYQNALSLAPGVNDADGDGNVTVHGSRERDFKTTVDGVSNVDPVTGQRMSQVNPDAIEEIEVVDTGADLSQGGAVGGYARITIKSGGNEFEGSASLYAVDNAIDNDGAGDVDPLPFKQRRPSVFVSGPVMKDRLWYSLAVDVLDQKQPVNVIGGEDAVVEANARTELGKLTWQINPKNRFALQYSADPVTIEPLGVTALRPAESSYDYESGGPTFAGKWTATLSPRSFWESTVAYSDIEYKFRPHELNVHNRCASGAIDGVSVDTLWCFDGISAFTSGTFPQRYQDTRERFSYLLDAESFLAEWLGGSHEIRYGTLLERTNWQRSNAIDPTLAMQALPQQVVQTDPQNPGLVDIGSVAASDLRITSYFPPQLDSEVRGNNLAFYFIDNYQPASNLTAQIQLRYNREELSADGFVPFDVGAERRAYTQAVADCIANPNNSPNACIGNSSAEFTASPYDNPNLYPACSVSLNPAQCTLLELARDSGHSLRFRTPEPFTVINSNLSRSLRVTWDPWNNGTLLSSIYTRVYGDAYFQLFLNEQGPDTLERAYRLNDQGEVLGGATTVGSAFRISQVDRNLNSPYVDEFVLGYEKQVANETSLKIRYISRDYKDLYQDVDVNHAPVYYDDLTPAQLAQFGGRCRRVGEFADCTGNTLSRIVVRPGRGQVNLFVDLPDGVPDLQVVSPMFNNIYLISNRNETNYKAYVFELERRFYQNWEGKISYTWSEAIGQAEDFADAAGDDVTNADDEKGPLGTDQRHVLKLTGRVLVNKWGGFRLGSNIIYQTGLPYSIISQRSVVDFPTDLSGGLGIGTTQYSTPRTTYPTGTRNDRRNPSTWRLDMNIQKEFKIKDWKATLQASVFNFLNQNKLQIVGIQRVIDYNASQQQVYRDFPASFRNFGRYFEVAFKLNF